MGWKFWQRDNVSDEAGGRAAAVKLSRPKEMPQQIGQYLVTQKKMDPDVVWALRCALRPHPQSKTRFDFRVFSSNAAQNAGVKVANFDSLESHPELVIFHGWYDKRSNQIELLDNGNAVD